MAVAMGAPWNKNTDASLTQRRQSITGVVILGVEGG